MSAPASFLWHDYETSGTDPRRERPTQFACWRTDTDLMPIGEPETIYGRPTADLLPDPESCLLTGLLPDDLEQRGVGEPEFAAFVHARMAQPGTCVVGYNSMRFDDEVSRFLFWRQFRDPYAHEWAQGNSRFDLIDVLRMTYALRPQGMQWPCRDDGQPSFRLEHLAVANGVEQARAHDATDDVRALVGLARLLRTHQPRLWSHALSLRNKTTTGAMLDVSVMQPLVHVSQRFAAARGCLAIVLPLLRHPRYGGRVVVVDLDPDPNSWVHLSATQMAERLYARADSGVERLPVKAVHLNRAPMLAPLGVLNGVDTERIALDPERCLRHAAVICAMPDLSLRVAEALRLADSELPAGAAPLDADRALYDGFIEGADRAVCQRVLKADPTRLRREDFRFADPRLHALLWRRQARWYPDSLSAAEQQQWRLEVQQRLSGQDGYRSLDAFDAQLAALRQSRLEQLPALQRLLQWRQARFGDMPPMQAHG